MIDGRGQKKKKQPGINTLSIFSNLCFLPNAGEFYLERLFEGNHRRRFEGKCHNSHTFETRQGATTWVTSQKCWELLLQSLKMQYIS